MGMVAEYFLKTFQMPRNIKIPKVFSHIKCRILQTTNVYEINWSKNKRNNLRGKKNSVDITCAAVWKINMRLQKVSHNLKERNSFFCELSCPANLILKFSSQGDV